MRYLPLPLVLSLFLSACGVDPDPGSEIRFDPCELVRLAPDSSAPVDALTDVEGAAVMWNLGAATRLEVAGPGAGSAADLDQIPIRFEEAAPCFYGLYQQGAVIINYTVVPGRARTITIAHELGHAFGLEHVSGRPSLMNPGNLSVELTEEDVAELTALWGECPGWRVGDVALADR